MFALSRCALEARGEESVGIVEMRGAVQEAVAADQGPNLEGVPIARSRREAPGASEESLHDFLIFLG